MLIKPEEINKVLLTASKEDSNRGKKIFEQGKVKVLAFESLTHDEVGDFDSKSYIEGEQESVVSIKRKKNHLLYQCGCVDASQKDTPCAHIVASMFNLYINFEQYINYSSKVEATTFNKTIIENQTFMNPLQTGKVQDNWLNYYEHLELHKNNQQRADIKLIPILELRGFKRPTLEVSFKIGTQKMYVLKDIYEFGQHMAAMEIAKYGKELSFVHRLSSFAEESRKLAAFLSSKTIEYNEFSKLGSFSFSMNKKYKGTLMLNYHTLDEFFQIMYGKKVEIEGYQYENLEGGVTLVEEDPNLEFDVCKTENGIDIIDDVYDYYLLKGQESLYVLYRDKLYHCSDEFKIKMYPLLAEFKKKTEDKISIEEENATSFCEYLIPRLSSVARVNIEDNLLKQYKAEKLATKIYLDIDEKNDIIAEVKFCYGNEEFNPFDIKAECHCNRNVIAEAQVKEIFKKYQFLINFKKYYMYLNEDETIYEFLQNGINEFMEKFEVLVTERLKNRQIVRYTNMTMGVRLQNNLLSLDIMDLGFDDSELKEVLKSYRQKKKYHRLKSGSYINLENSQMKTLTEITDHLGISEKDISSLHINLPKYRALYLNQLIKEEQVNVKKDDSFKELVKEIEESSDNEYILPKTLEQVLRSYQITGFRWLKTLEKYGFGGILADDMGLGKTIQIIAVLLDEKQNGKKTSLVVCPSSLYINWEREIQKFAPEIKILVVSGSMEQRAKLIKKANKFDVVITSYDLLKRDTEQYQDITFKYVIADEAQYIKNNNTKNAKALKAIKSQIRYALTGTPMENSLSELWSIFDFIMPGYLFSYKKFKEFFETPIIKDENKASMQRLQKLVSPFILRRIKKEVLKELPDKTETVMYSQMEEEQNKIYQAYLQKARKEMSEELAKGGFAKNQIKILALITRLRQICCHPSLFLEYYQGSSAKLIQCMEIVQEAVRSHHKILIFSQFTSMFSYLKKQLDSCNIKYLELTGKTQVDTRIELVEEFNKSEEISVFLISLKAGGTGLNLTGADMVIHFDPWWNLSAENQATDRAYRIGQKNNVQVFRLITQHSIEEKIQKLQDKKINLANAVVKEGETFINKMSKKEILDLFEN